MAGKKKPKEEMIAVVFLQSVASSGGSGGFAVDKLANEMGAIPAHLFEAWEAAGIVKRAPDDPGFADAAKAAQEGMLAAEKGRAGAERQLAETITEFEAANGAVTAELGALRGAVNVLVAAAGGRDDVPDDLAQMIAGLSAFSGSEDAAADATKPA